MRMVEASQTATGEKAKQLAMDAAKLLGSDNTQAFEQKEFTSKDYSEDRGFETNSKLLSMLSRHESGIPSLDEAETVWQLNWLRVHEPTPGETVTTENGQRLWLLVTVRDQTQHHSLYITEKVALQLSNHKDTASFMDAHANGTLWFPVVCSLKSP